MVENSAPSDIDRAVQEKLFLEDAEAGLVENVKKHIESNVNVMAVDGEKRTALHRASLEGHAAIVKIILNHYVKSHDAKQVASFANRRDTYGNTAIYLACVHPQKASLEIVRHLLDHGANRLPRKMTTGMTPLHWAAYNGDVDVAAALLNDKDGAQAVVATNKDKKTALDIAGEQYVNAMKEKMLGGKNGNPKIDEKVNRFKSVMTRMLNTLLPSDKKAKEKSSPFAIFRQKKIYWSAAVGDTERIKNLLAIGVLPTQPVRIQNNRCPLHIAVLMNELSALQMLVNALNTHFKEKGNINQRDLFWNTALHYACGSESGMGASKEAVKILLDANVPIDDSLRNRFNCIAYDYATLADVQEEMIRAKFTRDKRTIRDSPHAVWVIEVPTTRSTEQKTKMTPLQMCLNALQKCPEIKVDNWTATYNSGKTQLIAVHVSKEGIKTLAEKQNFEMRLLGKSGERIPYNRNKAHLFEPFRSRDSAAIVRIAIQKLIDVPAYVSSGAIEASFGLHDAEEIKDIYDKWIHNNGNYVTYPLSHIRSFINEGKFADFEALDTASNYLGEKHSFFLSWLSHYTTWLAMLVIPGITLTVFQIYSQVMQQSVESQWCVYYAILVALWGTITVEKWKRKQAELAFKWDMDDFEQEETIRDEFLGDEMVSAVTGEVEKFYPVSLRTFKQLAGLPFIFALVGMVIATFIAIIIFRQTFTDAASTLFASLLNGTSITVLNYIYKLLAEFLNHFENHRTDSDFEDSLVVKTFLFQFVNSNAAIFYSAFVTRDYVATNIQIATVIISKQAIDLATTAILPMIMNMFQRREFDANMQKKDSNTAHQRRMSTIGTSPNKQGSASKYSVSSSKTTMKKMPKRFAGQRDGLKAVMELYSEIDKDGSGTISVEEIGAHLVKLNAAYHKLHYATDITEENLGDLESQTIKKFRSPQHAMSHFDTNGDGWVSFAEFTHAFTCEITDLDDPLVLARNETERNAVMYDGRLNLINSYSQQVIQYGWIVMFSAACPIAPLLAMAMNTVKLRSEIILALFVFRRPTAKGAADIGVWLTIQEFLGLFGVIINCCILFFTFDDILKDWKDLFPVSFVQIVKERPETVLLLLLIEHVIIAVKLGLAQLIDDKPAWIHQQNKEKRYIATKNQSVEDKWEPTINEDGVPSINLSSSSFNEYE